MDIATYCRNLIVLDLAFSDLDDTSLDMISKHCAMTLEVLDISGCRNIQGEGIVSAARNCCLLIQLNIFGIRIGDREILALADHCPRLRICGGDMGSVSERTKQKLLDNCYERAILIQRMQ